MKIQIDQSGKIEQTNRDTILCLSNDEWDAVVIKAATKRSLQEIFRRNGQIRNYILFTFSAGISLLLKRNLRFERIIIDREYFGKEAVIKEIILQMLGKKKVRLEIVFENIGRRVNAHSIAYKIYSGELKTKIVLDSKQIFGEIKMTEVGKRLKNA